MTETELPDDENEEAAQERAMSHLKRHVTMLGEHFDTVQIIVTRHQDDGEGTVMASWGGGNWYARYGSVREFLLKEDERNRVSVRNE